MDFHFFLIVFRGRIALTRLSLKPGSLLSPASAITIVCDYSRVKSFHVNFLRNDYRCNDSPIIGDIITRTRLNICADYASRVLLKKALLYGSFIYASILRVDIKFCSFYNMHVAASFGVLCIFKTFPHVSDTILRLSVLFLGHCDQNGVHLLLVTCFATRRGV